MIEIWITSLWQKRSWATLTLLPLSFLYGMIIKIRRFLYQKDIFTRYLSPVPIIIVGNIHAGGTGKTPLTINLVNALKAQGFSPGIVSRGYKARISRPTEVTPSCDPMLCGDEPVLIAKRTQSPLFIYPKRSLAIQALCQAYPQCDVILCDDGLQHYALQRNIELAVIDASRAMGNGLLLPAGPLREPIERLKEVDFVVLNGTEAISLPVNLPLIHMTLQLSLFYQLTQPGCQKDATAFIDKHCHAITGIGHPERFLLSLQSLGLPCTLTQFPDHYMFSPDDLPNSDIIFVTEKDAVKLEKFKDDRIWVLPVNATTQPDLASLLVTKLHAIRAHNHGQKTA